MKRILMVLIFFMVMTGLGHASYKKALEFYQQKKYKDSLKILADNLDVDKDMEAGSPNYKIRFLAAHNHWKLGNSESCIAHFRRCMDIKKTDVNPYIDIAFYLAESKRYGDATDFAKRGLNIKKDSMLYYILGKVSLKRDNFWKAKEYFEKANSLNQEMYFSYNSLGITLIRLKKYSEANTAFTIASALYPDSPQILNNLGMSYELLGKYKRAHEYYRQSNLLDESNKQIIKNLQRVKKKLDK